jgi:hypothetical protein
LAYSLLSKPIIPSDTAIKFYFFLFITIMFFNVFCDRKSEITLKYMNAFFLKNLTIRQTMAKSAQMSLAVNNRYAKSADKAPS